MAVVTTKIFSIQGLFKALHEENFQQRQQAQVSVDKVTVSSMMYTRDIFVGKLIDPYNAQICMAGKVQKEVVCQPFSYLDYSPKV